MATTPKGFRKLEEGEDPPPNKPLWHDGNGGRYVQDDAPIPRWLTIEQVCEALSISKYTLNRLRKQGLIKAYNPGGGYTIRFSEEELQRFVAASEIEGVASHLDHSGKRKGGGPDAA